MEHFIPNLGQWLWWIVAAVLLIGELVAPGVFLIWLAAAAALTAIVDLVFGLGWQMEVAVFAVFAVLLVLLSWKWVMKSRNPVTPEPTLNRKQASTVGRRGVIEQAIVNGVGKVRIDDALWDVEGADAARGSAVVVKSVRGSMLVVETVP